jgi:hypothetical protein
MGDKTFGIPAKYLEQVEGAIEEVVAEAGATGNWYHGASVGEVGSLGRCVQGHSNMPAKWH